MARQSRNSKAGLGLLASAAAAVLLAFPGSASAAVTSNVTGGVLTVTGAGDDAITITSDGGQVEVNDANPGNGPALSADITAIEVTGGNAANSITLAGVNATNYPALTSVTVDGGDGNDTINGSQIADVLRGGDGDDRIIGDNNPLGTDDVSRGEAGNDTMVWNPGDGDDVNEGGDGTDTAEVNGGGDETFTVAPSATDPARVSFDRPSNPFNVDISDDTEKLDLNAANGVDNVTSGDGLNALGFALDIDGGPGNDVLDGGDGADLISGGDGDDRVIGDNNPIGTDDVSRGDAGNDTMVWNPGDGDDVNEGGDGSDTVEVNGGGAAEVFTVAPSATDPARVSFDRPSNPFNLDIGTSEKLDLNAAAGDDSLNATGVVNGLAGWTIDADGGDGNDTLAGASQAVDVLAGGAGADTLLSRDQTADSLSGGSEVDSAVVDAQDTVNADVENVDRGQAQQPPANDPPANDPPAQDTLAPAVKVSKKAVRVNRNRIAAVRVTGPAGEDSTVTAKLRRKGKLVGSKTIALDAGESKLVKVKLSRKTFALLKQRGRLEVKAIVTATDTAGNSLKRTVELKLRAPKPQR